MELKDLLPTTTFAERLRTNVFLLASLLFIGTLIFLPFMQLIWEAVSMAIFVPCMIFIARRSGICRSKAWLFAYLILAKFAILFSLLPHFSLSRPGSLTDSYSFWFAVCLGLIAWWTAAEGQFVTVRRLFSLTALVLVSDIANYWLTPHDLIATPHPGFDFFWIPQVRIDFLELDSLANELFSPIEAYFALWVIISFVAYLVLDKSNTSASIFSGLSYKAALQGDNINGLSFLAGTLAACCIIGLFSANNSYVFTGVRPYYFMDAANLPWLDFTSTVQMPLGQSYKVAGQNRLLYHLLQFDLAALKSGLAGIMKSAPFIALGIALTLIASRYRLTGLLPILAIGALAGLGWHFAYPSHGYWTPFMTTMQSAILIGMICATGFGAVAQLFPACVVETVVR